MGNDGEDAAKGHDEGEEEEGETMDGCDWFKDVACKGNRVVAGEKEGEGKVGEDCEGEELWG